MQTAFAGTSSIFFPLHTFEKEMSCIMYVCFKIYMSSCLAKVPSYNGCITDVVWVLVCSNSPPRSLLSTHAVKGAFRLIRKLGFRVVVIKEKEIVREFGRDNSTVISRIPGGLEEKKHTCTLEYCF